MPCLHHAVARALRGNHQAIELARRPLTTGLAEKYHILQPSFNRWDMSSLETAAAILKCFSVDHMELSVSEVARRLDLPKSTVSRLMKSMASCGLVEQHRESRHYRVGVLPFRLGGLYQAHNKVLEMADDALADLV